MLMYDIIIIGAGPAGMTAALYAKRANKKVLVLESQSYGGQIINANMIENYPGIEKISGYDYATTLYNQITALGTEIKYETVLKITPELIQNNYLTLTFKIQGKTLYKNAWSGVLFESVRSETLPE